jgi:hypothetical protein
VGPAVLRWDFEVVNVQNGRVESILFLRKKEYHTLAICILIGFISCWTEVLDAAHGRFLGKVISVS